MFQAFAANLIEAFSAPRTSARRIISVAPSMRDCLLMVVLAWALQSIVGEAFALIDPVSIDSARASATIGQRFGELVVQLILFLVLASGVFAVGQRFGGAATRNEVAAVVAWHTLVTSFLAPFNVIGMRAVDPAQNEAGAAFLLVPLSVGFSIWLFASFVAEAHGFRKIGGVIAVTIGGFIVLGLIAMILLRLVGAAG